MFKSLIQSINIYYVSDIVLDTLLPPSPSYSQCYRKDELNK